MGTYKENGRTFFVYQRVFPGQGQGDFRSLQTVVEELGVGPRWAFGWKAPFTAGVGRSFGGNTVGLSATPADTHMLFEYAFNLDTHALTAVAQNLTPLKIPQDDIGLAYNYGTHFTYVSATTPLTTIGELVGNTLTPVAKRTDFTLHSLRADGFFTENQGANTLDFITYGGAVTTVYTPPVGWGLYRPLLDRDSNTLVWFEAQPANQGLIHIYASPASNAKLTPRLVRTLDLGNPSAYNHAAILIGDLIAYGIDQDVIEIVRVSTGEARRVTIPYWGNYTAYYVDENDIWVPIAMKGDRPTSMLKLGWKSAPLAP